MASPRDPIADTVLLGAGQALWSRNENMLWSDIDSTERVLMAYAYPRAAWALSDADAQEAAR